MTAEKPWLMVALVPIMGVSILAAVSGAGRGTKWVSTINLGLSIAMLLILVVLGSRQPERRTAQFRGELALYRQKHALSPFPRRFRRLERVR